MHKSLSMTVAQKHAWLTQLLTPEVRSRVSEYLVSPSTYIQALKALKKIYGHGNLILHAHVQAILNFRKVKDGDLVGLEILLKTLNEALNFFQTNGFEADINALSTLYIISLKLPNKLLEAWVKKSYVAPSRLHLKDFAKWLEECVSIERSMQKTKTREQRERENPRGQNA